MPAPLGEVLVRPGRASLSTEEASFASGHLTEHGGQDGADGASIAVYAGVTWVVALILSKCVMVGFA